MIIIICPKHGEFQQSPHNHVRNNAGCPTCNESKGERRIRLYLQSNKIEFASQYKFDDCRNILKLPFDFAIWDSKKNLKLIEYQGKQHYKVMEWIDKKKSEGNLDKIIQRDKIKLDWCNKNNIPLLIIPYTEFQNIEGMLDFFCII